MKVANLSFLLFFLVSFFSSCSKDRTCTCTTTSSYGVFSIITNTTTYTVKHVTKNAVTGGICSSKMSVNNNITTSIDCKLN